MKSKLLFVFLCLGSFRIMAQQDTLKEKATITAAALFNSSVNYYGQATIEPLPYALLNATVRFPIGLSLSAGSYKLLNDGSGISETDLGIGFDYDASERLSMGIAYTRSFFPKNSPLLQASNTNNLNLSASYTLAIFKTAISTDYAFGQQNDIFLSLSSSKEIVLGNYFNEKNTFYIEPTIELVAGTRQFYERYTINKGKRDQAKGKAPSNPGNSSKPASSSNTATVESSQFNLLSYNFKLPLSFSRNNYIAEASYQFSVLGAKAEEELRNEQSYFGLAFYYQF